MFNIFTQESSGGRKPRAKRTKSPTKPRRKSARLQPRENERVARSVAPHRGTHPREVIHPEEKTALEPNFDSMSLTDLQNVARAAGIPFAGLSKSRLAKKIHKYKDSSSNVGKRRGEKSAKWELIE